MKWRIAIVIVLVAAVAGVVLLYLNGSLGIVNPDNRRVVKDDIDPDTFVKAYVELATLAETMPIGTPEYDQEKTRVLSTLGVTPEKVEKQLASYNNRPDQWRPIWEKIQAELTKRAKESIGTGSQPGDSTH